MTSRETTGILPRSISHPEFRTHKRTISGWASLLSYGAITWPFLLKSLYGGTQEGKRALLRKLGLPHDALPNLGSWKADVGLLGLVADHILAARPRMVVEFGTGASTLIIAQAMKLAGGGHLISIEQDADFADKTRAWLAEHGLEAEIRAVPLVPSPGGWPGLWYDHEPLPDAIDFLLIDGPPWTIHPLTRGAGASLFNRITPGGTVMLDDAARPGERVVARRWKKRWPDFSFRMNHAGSKGTLIGTRRR